MDNKSYDDRDVLPAILISLLIASFITLALHHKNETAALRRTIEVQKMVMESSDRVIDTAIVTIGIVNKLAGRQAKQIENYKTILRAMPPQEFRNQKGERI